MPLPRTASVELLSLVRGTSAVAVAVSRLRDGVFLEVNQGFAEMFGWPVAEIVGRTALDRDIWFDTDERNRFIDMLQREGRATDTLCRFRRRSGQVFHGHMSGSLFEVEGEPHIFTITHDVETLVQAQRRVEVNRDCLRTLLSNLPHGVRELDLSGVIVRENPAHAALFGYEEGELVGRRAVDLFADADHAAEIQRGIDSCSPEAGRSPVSTRPTCAARTGRSCACAWTGACKVPRRPVCR